MSKTRYLAELYHKASKELTSSPEDWKSMLETLGRYYKRSFDNCVLLHVQNPNAKQIGTYDEWNMAGINRKVKKGAKGVAVMDMENPQATLKYYFDINDTVGSLESYQKVTTQLWSLEYDQQSALIDSFHRKYGTPTERIELSLYTLIQERVEQYIMFNGLEMGKSQGNHSVSQAEVKRILSHSIYYTIATRTGLDTTKVNFQGIEQFQDFQSFKNLGLAITGNARPILNEINHEITNIKLERSKQYEERSHSTAELHRGSRRSNVSRPEDISRGTHETNREVGQNLERIPNGTQAQLHQRIGDGGNYQPESSRNGREAGTNEGRTDSKTTGTISYAQHREHIGGNGTHEANLSPSRGTSPSDTAQLKQEQRGTNPSNGSEMLSLDGFFAVPPVKAPPVTATTTENTEDFVTRTRVSEPNIPPPVQMTPPLENVSFREEGDSILVDFSFQGQQYRKQAIHIENQSHYVLIKGELIGEQTKVSLNSIQERALDQFRQQLLQRENEQSKVENVEISDTRTTTETKRQVETQIVLGYQQEQDDILVYNQQVQDEFGNYYPLAYIEPSGNIVYNGEVTLTSNIISEIEEKAENYRASLETKVQFQESATQNEPAIKELVLPNLTIYKVQTPEIVEETQVVSRKELVLPDLTQYKVTALVKEPVEITDTAQDETLEEVQEEMIQLSLFDNSYEDVLSDTSDGMLNTAKIIAETSTHENKTEPQVETKTTENETEPLVETLEKEQKIEEPVVETENKPSEMLVKPEVLTLEDRRAQTYEEYLKLKQDYSEEILFYPFGDFYEVMGEDSERIAHETDYAVNSITLKEGKTLKILGVPKHSIEDVVKKLEQEAFPVVVVNEQQERIQWEYHNILQKTNSPLNQKEKEEKEEKEERVAPELLFFDTIQSVSVDEHIYQNNDIIGYDGDRVEYRLAYIGGTAFYQQTRQNLSDELEDKFHYWKNEATAPKVVKVNEVNFQPWENQKATNNQELSTEQSSNEEKKTRAESVKEEGISSTIAVETERSSEKEPLFFDDIDDLHIELSDYEDGELIGYNRQGIKHEVAKFGTTGMIVETSAIGPQGELLGDHMDAATYQKFRAWHEGESEAKAEENVVAVSKSIPNTSVKTPIPKPEPINPADSKRNYRYSTEHNLYSGGAKSKFKANVEAIKTLKLLEEEQRDATSDEQITLAGYVGWGGLANALTPDKVGWENEYREVKGLLTDDEFVSATESTLTAYYTEQMIVGKMYKALDKAGFKQGTILDPAMGTGNFFSILPENMTNSKLYGVELDSVTGRIAQKLYPNAEIQVRGFEHTSYPDNFFDVTIGNIPFNSFRINDPKYNKHKFQIHDYFIAKSIDQVRPNGIIAVITSKGTLDKNNSKMREYVAQRAELLGAIRLPNTAFKQVAGTEVTSDILFFKKREKIIVPSEENSPWLKLAQNEDGIPVNQYFIDHPEMILGKMVYDESMYGNEETTACHPIEGEDLERKLEIAVGYLDFQYEEPSSVYIKEEEQNEGKEVIEADHRVKNHSYTVVNDQIYFRENSKMYPQDFTGKKAERVKGLVQIHEDVKELIDYQTDLFIRDTVPKEKFDHVMAEMRANLNKDYDLFVKKHGFINLSANVSAFRLDGAAPLIRTLEKENPEKEKEWLKNDIFYKPTISIQANPTEAHSAQDALMLSMNYKGSVDLEFMASIYVNSEGEPVDIEEIIEELEGQIYQDPDKITDGFTHSGYVVAEEYLSGYVKDKLNTAKFYADGPTGRFAKNVEALETVQPIPIQEHEINVRLGTTWVPTEIYESFIYEVCDTAGYHQNERYIALEYSKYGNRYHISGKNTEHSNVKVNSTYGTNRINAYEIIEDSLNLQKSSVKDPVDTVDAEGKSKKIYVMNRNETILARSKQEELERKFKTWLFAEPERSEKMVQLYNDTMNNIVVRRFSGAHLTFPEQNPEIKLRTHQKDVVAHGLFSGGNLMMAHEVGAGKTFSAITLAHEMKRLGIAKKPLITVPNHLVGQWADAFMSLYPDSNIMVANSKDLKKEHRQRFISRIATSDFDAIIIAHSSFELISMSNDYKIKILEQEITEISTAITSSGKEDKWGTKQMQLFHKRLKTRYDELVDGKIKDDVVNFEQLGVDALFVDESHLYKNNFSYSKLRGVAGIGGNPSQRAMDMHLKAQYISKINDGRGVIYLTGTPVSNTLAELFVIQKTLQPHELEKRNLLSFDNWVSTFAEITSENEIKPEGSGWQIKNRLSNFHNTPEVMNIFTQVADIRTAEMLDEIPVPKSVTHNIETKATPIQKAFIKEFAERGEEVRRNPQSRDNFLSITQDARNCAIDPQILDASLLNDLDSKMNRCGQNVAEIYHETEDDKLTQLVFCDKGVPNNKAEFDFYHGLKREMMRCGVPEEQIAFIHDYKTDETKEKLFDKIRKGDLRILIGSTAKMGAGLNVQDKLFAVHHLDVPWKPSDLCQRNGRILRQGNENPEVHIYNYVTAGTFDSYLWQILEKKQKFISQIMSGDTTIRTCDDIDDVVIEYAALKAMAMDNPRLKEKMEIDNDVNKLLLLKSAWEGTKSELKTKIDKSYPNTIANLERKIEKMKGDVAYLEKNSTPEFQITIDGTKYSERAEAAEHLGIIHHRLGTLAGATTALGEYHGFQLSLTRLALDGVKMVAKGQLDYSVELGNSMLGAIQRLENQMKKLPEFLTDNEKELVDVKHQLEQAKMEAEKPFPDGERLEELQTKKTKLDLELEFGTGDELGKDIFYKLQPFLQPLLDGETDHMKYENEPYMPLTVEKIGTNEYSICHYYEQNGDLMRDPEITFSVEDGAVKPSSYQQDGNGIYYRCDDVEKSMVDDLKSFMLDWGNNLEEQGYLGETLDESNQMEQ